MKLEKTLGKLHTCHTIIINYKAIKLLFALIFFSVVRIGAYNSEEFWIELLKHTVKQKELDEKIYEVFNLLRFLLMEGKKLQFKLNMKC